MVSTSDIHRGMRIRGADGKKLGRVTGVEGDRIHATHGFLIRRKLTLGLPEVQAIEGGELRVSRRLYQGLEMSPGALEQARMDSAKFQDHQPYDVSKKAQHQGSDLEDARMHGLHGMH